MKRIIIGFFFLTASVASVFGAEVVKEWKTVGQSPLIPGGVREENIQTQLLQYKNDILKGLTAAGEKQPVAILQELVDAAPGIECALPQGTTFEYMIFKGGQVLGGPVKWIGETSLRGFLIKTTEREFFVVAGCGNIAALPPLQKKLPPLQKKEAEAPSSTTIEEVEEQPAPPPLEPPGSWSATRWSSDWWSPSYSYYGGYYDGYYGGGRRVVLFPTHHHHHDADDDRGGQPPRGKTKRPSPTRRGPTVRTH